MRGIRQMGGSKVGWGVSEVLEGLVASFNGYRKAW
jgi:hypothetical protein